jgi:hypothetical protein
MSASRHTSGTCFGYFLEEAQVIEKPAADPVEVDSRRTWQLGDDFAAVFGAVVAERLDAGRQSGAVTFVVPCESAGRGVCATTGRSNPAGV